MTEPAQQPEPAVSAIDAPANTAVKFQGIEPIASVGNLKGLLERNMANLAAVLPRHVTADRLLKTLYVAVNRNPDILACAQSSIVEAIQRAGELGLDLSGTMGEAYIIPSYDKIKWTERGEKREKKMMVARLQPGYQGLAKLARQSGELALMECDAVYEKDKFILRKGSDFECLFEPFLLGERGRYLGCYAYFKLKDGSQTAEWMSADDIDKVRRRAPSAESPAWRDYPDQMGRKVVFKRGLKWVPKSAEKPEFQKLVAAIETDNLAFDALAEEVQANADGGVARLEDRLLGTSATQQAEDEGRVIDTRAAAAPEPAEARQAAGNAPPARGTAPSPSDRPAEGTHAPPRAEIDGEEPGGKETLSDAQVGRLREMAEKAGVSWQALENRFGGPIESYGNPHLDAAGIEQRVISEIRALAKLRGSAGGGGGKK